MIRWNLWLKKGHIGTNHCREVVRSSEVQKCINNKKLMNIETLKCILRYCYYILLSEGSLSKVPLSMRNIKQVHTACMVVVKNCKDSHYKHFIHETHTSLIIILQIVCNSVNRHIALVWNLIIQNTPQPQNMVRKCVFIQ